MDFAYTLQPVKTKPYFPMKKINSHIGYNIFLTKNTMSTKNYGNQIGIGRPKVIPGITFN